MESDDQYIKASRYDLKGQSHNRRVFHRVLMAHPWRAVAFAIGMGVLAAIPAFNLVDAPRWAPSKDGMVFGLFCVVVRVVLLVLCLIRLGDGTVEFTEHTVATALKE